MGKDWELISTDSMEFLLILTACLEGRPQKTKGFVVLPEKTEFGMFCFLWMTGTHLEKIFMQNFTVYRPFQTLLFIERF